MIDLDSIERAARFAASRLEHHASVPADLRVLDTDVPALCRELREQRARVAELEAERDAVRKLVEHYQERAGGLA